MDDIILSTLLDEQSNGLMVLNEDLIVLYANKKIREFFSSDTDQLLGNYIKCNNTIVECTYCQQTSKCNECILSNTIKELKKNKEKQTIGNLKFNSNGKYINMSLVISYIKEYIVLEFTDLCNIYEEVNFLSLMMDKSKDIMFYKDSNLKYKYVNKKCAELFNCEKHEMINKDDSQLLKENKIDELLYKKLNKSDLYALENKFTNYVICYNEINLAITKEKIEDGILCIGRDITEELNANKKAETDVLTGLFNRRKFISDIDKILACGGEGFYLALIDIDNLKGINNNYGHLKGDEYLSKLGEILKSNNSGRFYRTGGDEFAGIIKLKKNNLKSLFDKIFETLKGLNYNPELTISVGVNKIDTSKTYVENYKEADILLYEVKKKGKNSILIE